MTPPGQSSRRCGRCPSRCRCWRTGCAGTGAGIRTPVAGSTHRPPGASRPSPSRSSPTGTRRLLGHWFRSCVGRRPGDPGTAVPGRLLRGDRAGPARPDGGICAGLLRRAALARAVGRLAGRAGLDGPGWPEVRLADFAPALGPKGLSRIADLVAERSPVQAAEPAAELARDGHLDPEAWHQEWAARYLREQLAELTGDVDHYVAVLAEYLGHTDRYRMIAAALRDADRPAEAIGWARRGLAARPGDPHADRLRDLLVDLLIEAGDTRAAVAERRAEFQRRPITTTFQALHATVTRVGLDVGPVTDGALDILRPRPRIHGSPRT